jgi:hypothetical protein
VTVLVVVNGSVGIALPASSLAQGLALLTR